MDTTLRISKAEKGRLQRLQHSWRLARGESPTQQELLEQGLRFLERHMDQFLAESAWRPLTATDLRELRKLARFEGDWTAGEIDEVVYGKV